MEFDSPGTPCDRTGGMYVNNLLLLALVIAVWFVLMRFVLPRFGVPT